jgi:hypothetical protein
VIHHGRELADGQTGRGSVNAVTRKGDTVLRPAGPWTPSVHRLLRHLESAGFAYAPKVVALDRERGVEQISYIEGQAAMRPWPPYLTSESGITAIARLLRDYHRAVQHYTPSRGSTWRVPDVSWRTGMIVRHGDLGPWNMVWNHVALVGLIDWDLAQPGYPIEDVAQAAWYCVPLLPPEKCAESGINPQDQSSRLRALCDAYGVSVRVVVQSLLELQKVEVERTKEWGAAGIEPWRSFAARGDCDEIAAESRWLWATFGERERSVPEGRQGGRA